MKVDKKISDIDTSIARLKEEKIFLEANEEILSSCPFLITYSGKNTRIIIHNLNDLTAARRFMKKMFGTSKFEYNHSFYSGCTISTFHAKDVDWEIWLECSVEDFPSELKKNDNCKWVETEAKDYYMVCDL
jgi:hypothetical protein